MNPQSRYFYPSQYGYSSMFTGDTKAFSLPISSCDGGAFLNTLGATVDFTLKNIDTGNVVFTNSTTYTTSVEMLQVIMSSAETDVEPGIYSYSFKMTDSSGNVTTLACERIWIRTC